MSNEKAITLSYEPVTRAGAGQGKQGKLITDDGRSPGKAAGGGGGAAKQLSYISGETTRDERTHQWYAEDRSDVLEVRVNFRPNDPRPTKETLQDLIKEIEQRDGRSNSRQGARTIVALPVDPREDRSEKVLAEHGIDREELRRKMNEARSRICENYDAEVRRLTRGATAYAMHASPEKGGREDQIHLHHFGTRRQVEVDDQGQVIGLSKQDVTQYSSPGHCTAFILHMRQFLEKEINRELERIDSLDRWESRSYQKQMADENAERAQQGLMPLEEFVPMQHEGASVTYFRRKLKKDPDIEVPPEIRAKIKENDKIRENNRAVEKTNHEQVMKGDRQLQRVIEPLRQREADVAYLQRYQARQKAGERITGAETARALGLWQRLDQPDYALQKQIRGLPEPMQEHLQSIFPESKVMVSAMKELGSVLDPEGQRKKLDRDDGWSLYALPT